METSNQTEDSLNPYGEPPQYDQESPPQEETSWGWQPKPPVTRAATAAEYTAPENEPAYLTTPEPAPELGLEPAPEPAPQSWPQPAPVSPTVQVPVPQQFYAPKVQPIRRPQPTQPLDPAPVVAAAAAPAPAPAPAPPAPSPPPQKTLQPSGTTGATPTAAAAVAAAAATRRRPILSEEGEKAEQLGLAGHATTSYMVSGVRHANKRRSNNLFKLLGLLFAVNLLIIGAFGAWLYNYFVTQMESRMADFANRPQISGTGGTSGARLPLAAGSGGATSVEIKQLQDDFEKRYSDLKSQLQAAQSRITEFESAQQQHETRVTALSSQMAKSAGDAATKGPVEAVASAVVPGVESEVGLSENELILLKERNRLTSYADEAIATGAREPYDRLWEALEDPRLIKLIHAARAEILRVQNFYLSGSRIETYTIQVGDYFPESASLKDSQLRDEQLIELLEKKEHPWQVRMKSANLLGLRRSRAVGDALVRAVKYDPNLDVVKEATFSFEQMSGYRARIFEPASMDAWWTQYNAAPSSASKNATAATDTTGNGGSGSSNSNSKKKSPPPPAVPVASPDPVKEMQPELRLPEWDEEQEARDRADKAVADQQAAREKKDVEKRAAARAASDEQAPPKKKKDE